MLMMRRFIVAVSATLFCASVGFAQPTNEEILSRIPFRSIGPAVMSGRIANMDVDPKNKSVIYIASASGGVWKSTSGGVNWRPIFDTMDSASIGDVKVSRADSNIVWVGAGESNNRNSSAWGFGMYKSTDAGETWKKVGLEETQQIARIVTHPKDPKKIWAAVIGPLWGASEHRGVYMTEDGGETWKKVLYVDEKTGAIDIVIDPKNPNILFAGMYERMRFPWTFYSGGPNGGVFRSKDGGKTWTKLTKGLPTGSTGRIGLTIYPKNPKIVYAIIEAERGTQPEQNQNGVYRSDDGGDSWKKMGTHTTRPFYYHEIMVDPNDDTHLYSLSTQLMESTDSGLTWRPVRISIHVDFHAIWIDPDNSQHFWVGNDGGAAETWDGGRTWRWANGIVVAQFYAIGFDMANPYHVYGGLQDNGSWGGPSRTRVQRGIGNFHWYRVAGGDGFHVQVDPVENTTVYAESQGGAIVRFDKKTGQSRSIRPRPPQGETYRFNWSSPIVLSPHNPRTVWFGGNKLFKSVDRGDNWQVVSPDLTTNDPKKQEPMGGLTPERTGAETHCTIITISESPVRPDVVWVGTDDGLVHVTKNGGVEWTSVTANLVDVPANTWCSRVEASRYSLERCYATFDGHRSNDMKPYVLMTDDFGKTWKNITNNLPANGSVYVIKEDPMNPDLLYVGTEFGLFVSFNRGETWTQWKTNFPTVAVHDLAIHPREREIVVGTHGRGIYIAPVEALQQLNDNVRLGDFKIFDPIDAYLWYRDTSGSYGDGEGFFYGQNPPAGARIAYYLRNDVEDIKLEVLSASGEVRYTFANPPKQKGVHVVYWPMTPQAGQGQRPLSAGSYGIRLTLGGNNQTAVLNVKNDPSD